ncbi:MAG TPA: ATP-binding protein [Gemmatimonadales bacterium]|nr:ATP-binding protein [Gemmatimonadales bacterium]
MWDPLDVYATANRARLLVLALVVIAGVAVTDWLTKPYLSLGFLYLFPIIVVAGFLSRAQTVAIALLCAVLQEAFSNLPEHEAIVRLILSSAGFVGTGLFAGEAVRSRHKVLRQVAELEDQVRLRRDAEEQLRVLVESSPAAIVVINSTGRIELGNEAALNLFEPDGSTLVGRSISAYLPALAGAVTTYPSLVFRTAMQCRGQRGDGETFLAGVWFSTYTTISGRRLAAVIVDLSEDLHSREDLSLDRVFQHARIVVSAMTHEIRNLSGAARIVHRNLAQVRALEQNEDFRALNTLIQGLENLSTFELRSPQGPTAAEVELNSVLDEVRILIAAAYRDASIRIDWRIPERLGVVWADRYGLIQVFLNLARNSQRAMQETDIKCLRVTVLEDGRAVVIRFEDTGSGIAAPETLFRPFQRHPGSGLGLFVSRAVMRSFGGDLVHEPSARGSCFVVVMPLVAPTGAPDA